MDKLEIISNTGILGHVIELLNDKEIRARIGGNSIFPVTETVEREDIPEDDRYFKLPYKLTSLTKFYKALFDEALRGTALYDVKNFPDEIGCIQFGYGTFPPPHTFIRYYTKGNNLHMIDMDDKELNSDQIELITLCLQEKHINYLNNLKTNLKI